MSIEIMVEVWKCEALKDQAETLIMLALADMANNDGVCWPGLELIATRSRVTRSYVVRVLRSLRERNIVTWERGHTGKSNRYAINRAALVNSVHQGSELSTLPVVNSVHSDSELSTPQSSVNPKVKPKGSDTPRPEWVEIYHTAVSRYPSKTTWQTVAAELGDDFDRERFGAICREWSLRGFNPANLSGILSVYRDGWRETPARGNGNGTAGSWSNTQSVGASLPKIRRITA